MTKQRRMETQFGPRLVHKATGIVVAQLRGSGSDAWPEGEPIYLVDPPEGKTKSIPASRKDYLRSLDALKAEEIGLQDYRRAAKCMNACGLHRAEEDAAAAFIGHVAYIKYPEEGATYRWFLSPETLALQDGFDHGRVPPVRFDIELRAATGSDRLTKQTAKTRRRRKAGGSALSKDPTRSPARRRRRPEYDTTTRNGILIARDQAA